MAKVLLFGPLSDVLGTEALSLNLTDDIHTVNELLAVLQQRGQLWQKYLHPDKLQITVNRQFCGPAQAIADTDEIALIPLPGTV